MKKLLFLLSLLLVSVTSVKSQYVFQRVSGVYKLKNVSGFVTTTVTNQNNESSEVVFPMNDIPTNFVVKVLKSSPDSVVIDGVGRFTLDMNFSDQISNDHYENGYKISNENSKGVVTIFVPNLDTTLPEFPIKITIESNNGDKIEVDGILINKN